TLLYALRTKTRKRARVTPLILACDTLSQPRPLWCGELPVFHELARKSGLAFRLLYTRADGKLTRSASEFRPVHGSFPGWVLALVAMSQCCGRGRREESPESALNW